MENSEFAGYSLLKTIGRGGVATVYKAVAPSGETVAVKILNTEIAVTNVIRQRFRREFEVTRKVSHPSIVKYLDFGIESGLPYVVMEYVNGTTLWNHVRKKGPLPEGDVVALADRLGSALDAGHRMKILHRDVKPTNVILDKKGAAKLMDYGLVKEMESTLNLTDNQAILGTPFFMAPEQFFDAQTVDHRCDIYGLAASLYFALTARIPFKFRGVGLLEKKLAGQFQPSNASMVNVSAEIIGVIAKGLQPEPADRPPTAGKLAERLRAAASPESKAAPKRAGPGGIERRSAKRRSCDFRGRCISVAGEPPHPVRISDISNQGVCLVCGTKLAPKKLICLSFHFRDDNEDWDYQMRVVNVRRSGDEEWRHGCRFVQPMDRAEFKVLINENGDKIEVRVAPG